VTKEDIGKNKAEIVIPKIAELNPYVPVKHIEGPLTQQRIKPFEVTNRKTVGRKWTNRNISRE
jgi:tRNA A37 threonylcarbamoyladenosine dehydratase